MDDDLIWNGAVARYYNSLVNEIQESLAETALHINLTNSLKEAVINAQIHQEMHIKDMRLTEQSLDIYKALSWITWFMAVDSLNGGEELLKIVVRAGINELNETLLLEEFCNESIPYRSRDLMESYLLNEVYGLSNHGIALNGLFMAFHSVRETLNNFK